MTIALGIGHDRAGRGDKYRVLRAQQPKAAPAAWRTQTPTPHGSPCWRPASPATARPRGPPHKGLLARLGPGLITGASDDDPSGIATYSQAGAQFGYAMCWVMLFCFPLMAAIQEISARIGRVTGQGIAGNIRAHYPRWLLRAHRRAAAGRQHHQSRRRPRRDGRRR